VQIETDHDDIDDETDHEDELGLEERVFRHSPVRRRLVDDMFSDAADDEEIKVFVGYTSKKARERVERDAVEDRIDYDRDFSEVGAVAVKMTKKKLKKLERTRGIKYIEPNDRVYAMAVRSRQVIPYGIRTIKAVAGIPPGSTTVGDCSSTNSLKVAIVDSGIYAGHQDLACTGPGSSNCVGESFGTIAPWYADQLSHGTSD